MVQHVVQIKNGIIIHVSVGVKSIACAKKQLESQHIYLWEQYVSKGIDETLVSACDEIVNAADIASTNVTNTMPTNMTNTISTNVTSTTSTDFEGKKLRYKKDCYILHKVILVIM